MQQTSAASGVSIAVMLLLFTVSGAFEATRLSSLSANTNGDIWLHLSSGLWILHNHAIPRTGLFSQSSSQPWIASSWAYDALLAAAYRRLDLSGIPIFLMFFRAALAALTFFLGGGSRRHFWRAVALSATAQYILATVPPGPVYCSIILFGLVLLVLLEARQSVTLRSLYWLPPIFLLWANLHIQFVEGVVALLLLFVAALAWRLAPERRKTTRDKSPAPTRRHHNGGVPSIALGSLTTIAAISLAATLITPYLYRPYTVFFASAFSSANQYLPDHKAPSFRQPQDYILLLLVMSAFLVLGLRRSRDPSLLALLAGCAALSFFSQRDTWLVTLAAVAVIGSDPRPLENSSCMVSNRNMLIAAALAVALLLIAALHIPPREVLLAKAAQGYPVTAADYIRDHHLPQPLFNAYEWGGFLTWYLPDYPVAIDARTGHYDNDFITQYSKAMNADIPYKEFPAMADARTIILPRTAIIAQALSTLPVYKIAYSDPVAVVLTKEEKE
jgi:hypothetical protein